MDGEGGKGKDVCFTQIKRADTDKQRTLYIYIEYRQLDNIGSMIRLRAYWVRVEKVMMLFYTDKRSRHRQAENSPQSISHLGSMDDIRSLIRL